MEFQEIIARVNNYREGRVLIAAVELDLFTCVGNGATLDEISERMETDFRATHVMLDALAALGMLDRQGLVYSLTPLAKEYLSAGGTHDSRALLQYQNELWHRWTHLSTCLRTTSCHVCERYKEQGPEWWQTFTRAMQVCAGQRAPKVMAAVDLSGTKRMLELTGGGGGYGIAFAQAFPELTAVVFDQPSVLSIARNAIRHANLNERVTVQEGDLLKDSFGSGYDLIYLPNVCQRYSPEHNRALLPRVFEAMAPGGRIVIEDYVMADDRMAPVQGALTALGMILNTREGGTYTRKEFQTWLAEAGFSQIETHLLPSVETDLVTAVKPA